MHKFVNRYIYNVPYTHNISIPNYGRILFWNFLSLRLTNIVLYVLFPAKAISKVHFFVNYLNIKNKKCIFIETIIKS